LDKVMNSYCCSWF